jgi:hypothetical protein
MSKFELTAHNEFVKRATIVDDPVLVDTRLQDIHSDLKAILFRDAIRGG